jgi:polar amino acid transport system permease protein
LDVGQQLIFLLEGVPLTFSVSIIAFFVGLGIGLPLAFLRVYDAEVGFIVDVYEKVFRGIPEIVLMLFLYFGLGPIFSFPFGNPFFVAALVLGLSSGADQSQIFRGAIRGVGDEQMIAAQSVGCSKWQGIWHIMVPQVITFSTPSLGSEYALLIKNSSYVWVIGILDIMQKALYLKVAQYELITPFIFAAVLYIALTFPIAMYLDRLGNKRKKKIGL